MRIRSTVHAMPETDVRAAIAGLPEADGYDLIVRPLRYRSAPHLAAYTIFDDRTITLQIPEPFYPFGEIVHFGAKRLAAKGMKFVPLSEGVTFRSRAEVARFLYCHEWYHWYLYEVLHKNSSAETACDRFALHNYRRRTVTVEDARRALRRRTRA
ncbi:MAG: hypothetical protein ACXVP8_10375 [Actinomycetota bacterium]